MKYGVINENHLFVKCYNRGKKVVTKRIVLFVLEDKHARFLQRSHPNKEKINRVGISVTKKLGGAVARNRAKRIMREAWRQVTKTYPLVKGKLVVISAREAAGEAKTGDIVKDLTYAAHRLGLIAEKSQ
ncbi:MAG: ribonuclease P protein component [Clostridia bacterium]|nr:ribonuclease P protein component [Clostridia bacterium]